MMRSGLGVSANAHVKLDILSVNSWQMQAEVAEKYSNEHMNAFLVGDAAHRFPPAGGFGMNSGLQDVHNLAWKLAMVCQGRASPTLLSTYGHGEMTSLRPHIGG